MSDIGPPFGEEDTVKVGGDEYEVSIVENENEVFVHYDVDLERVSPGNDAILNTLNRVVPQSARQEQKNIQFISEQ